MTDEGLFPEELVKRVYIATYDRYRVRNTEECATEKKAQDFLWWGAEEGFLARVSITDPDGNDVPLRED